MMLNPMSAGRPEPQWTQYDPGRDFEDCEYMVDEMEILGVKQKYIMIRGTIMSGASVSIDMPVGVTVSFPFDYPGTAIVCDETYGRLRFWSTNLNVSSSGKTIDFNSAFGSGARCLVFARVK